MEREKFKKGGKAPVKKVAAKKAATKKAPGYKAGGAVKAGAGSGLGRLNKTK